MSAEDVSIPAKPQAAMELEASRERRKRRLQETGEASIRTPWIHWRNNAADRIEKQLQEDGHRTWGFVIYRTTYGKDADWEEFLRRLQVEMKRQYEDENGTDILDLFSLTVIEDHNLDGVGAQEVHRRFLEWRTQALEVEQGAGVKAGWSPRYRFAIQVDADALHAVVHDVGPPESFDTSSKGWIKLVNADWQADALPRLQANLGGGLSMSLSLPATKDYGALPAVEGVMEPDVGWMRVPYQYVQSETYCDARDKNWWVSVYCRPPTVSGSEYDD